MNKKTNETSLGRSLAICFALASIAACSSSSPGSGSDGDITCMGSPSAGPYATACMNCASCDSQASAVQSSCASFVTCLAACSCSDDTCLSNCASKLSSQCNTLTTEWGDCDKTKCSSACTQG
jgi:hypothetical protein